MLRAFGAIKLGLGKPSQALSIWKLVPAEELQEFEEKRKFTEAVLPIYSRLQQLYLAALTEAGRQSYSQSEELFKQLFETGKHVRLPVDYYYGYMLMLASSRQLTAAANVLAEAPMYCQQHAKIMPFAVRLRNTINTLGLESGTVSKNRPLGSWTPRRAAMSAATFATVATIGLFLLFSGQFPKYSSADVDQPVAEMSINSEGANSYGKLETLEVLEAELEKLRTEKTAILEQLTAAEDRGNQLEGQSNHLTETIEAAIGSVESAREAASLNAYRKAMSFNRQGEYEKAVHSFELSLEQGIVAYYSDDALYYLIQALEQILRNEEARSLRQQFIERAGSAGMLVYQESPYLDDLMLQEATSLMEDGRTNDATFYYQKLRNEYGTDWTGKRADSIITALELE